VRLSKRCEYALRALIDLGLAREAGRARLPASELAEHQRIPVRFLEQILLLLRNAGFIESRRGARGGYLLARPADTIRMGDVIRLMDGPLGPIACVATARIEECTCPDPDHCGLRLLMTDLRNAATAILDRNTLANVVDVTLRKLRRDGAAIPFQTTV